VIDSKTAKTRDRVRINMRGGFPRLARKGTLENAQAVISMGHHLVPVEETFRWRKILLKV
jgi:hypothetical protein